MNKKLGLLAVAVAILLPPSAGMSQQTVRWEPTLESAQRLAGQTNRLVLIYFSGPSCGYCRRMEAEVLSQPSVAAAINADYVAVKIVADYFPATAQRYGITHLPTTVIALPQGQWLDSKEGYVPADEYVARLGQVALDGETPGEAVVAQMPLAPTPPLIPTGVESTASQSAGNGGAADATNRVMNPANGNCRRHSCPAASRLSARPWRSMFRWVRPAGGSFAALRRIAAPIAPRRRFPQQPPAMQQQPPADPAAVPTTVAVVPPQNNVAPPARCRQSAAGLDGCCPVTFVEKDRGSPAIAVGACTIADDCTFLRGPRSNAASSPIPTVMPPWSQATTSSWPPKARSCPAGANTACFA